MEIIPIHLWSRFPGANNQDPRQSLRTQLVAEEKTQFRRHRNQSTVPLEQIASQNRVLIVEGISGSGKDTFQSYLKSKLAGRDVRDYSEGEVLLSWNQLQINGVFNLQLKFMKLFLNYISDNISQDSNTIFILNRFHLSAYVLAVIKNPKLEKEYNEIIDALRKLPVHIFILQLDENEAELRSLHPERADAWQKFQQQIVKKDGFRSRVDRYMWQQRIMLEAAEKQKIPYSVVKLPSISEIEKRQDRIPETGNIYRPSVRTNANDTKAVRRRREVPETL